MERARDREEGLKIGMMMMYDVRSDVDLKSASSWLDIYTLYTPLQQAL
jgi:hypothetical protein